MKIEALLPPKQLRLNRGFGITRQRMLSHAKYGAEYRWQVRTLATAAKWKLAPHVLETLPWRAATIQLHFLFPNIRRRDVANFAAAMKHGIDGLTDARIIVDDDRITWLPPTHDIDRERPRVVLEVFETRGP